MFCCLTRSQSEPAAEASRALAASLWGLGCLACFRNRPSSLQVLRFKDVPFLPSAAQDGLSPALSAPREPEKALFVPFLKAPQCGYLILFQINIGGHFRWLSCVKGTLYPSTVLRLQGTMGSCKDMQMMLSQCTPVGDFSPLPLRKSKKTSGSLASNTGGKKNRDCRFSLWISLKDTFSKNGECYPSRRWQGHVKLCGEITKEFLNTLRNSCYCFLACHLCCQKWIFVRKWILQIWSLWSFKSFCGEWLSRISGIW